MVRMSFSHSTWWCCFSAKSSLGGSWVFFPASIFNRLVYEFHPFFHSKGFTNLIPRTSQDSKNPWRLLPTFRSGKQKRGNLYKVTSPPQGKQGPANSTNGGLHSPLIAGLSPPKTPKTGEKMVPIGEGVSENGAFGGQICNAKKLFFCWVVFQFDSWMNRL